MLAKLACWASAEVLLPLCHLTCVIAGTFTGERWLDQTMQLPSVKSKGFIFTQTGVVYAVPVDRLPSCEGASFEDLAISKVHDPVSQTTNLLSFHVCLA